MMKVPFPLFRRQSKFIMIFLGGIKAASLLLTKSVFTGRCMVPQFKKVVELVMVKAKGYIFFFTLFNIEASS